MNITINGEEAFIDEMTVVQYLESVSIDPKRVAVELNLEILPKSEYVRTTLKDGDSLEIVHFVGGGQAVRASTRFDMTETQYDE